MNRLKKLRMGFDRVLQGLCRKVPQLDFALSELRTPSRSGKDRQQQTDSGWPQDGHKFQLRWALVSNRCCDLITWHWR